MSAIFNMAEKSAEFDKLANIPKDLLKYLRNVHEGNVDEPLGRAMCKPEWKDTLQKIDKLFAKVSKVMGLVPEEICLEYEFKTNDTGLGKIDAFLAELRFAVWLDWMGFHDIKRVPSGNGPKPDFHAKRGKHCYYAEVFCITTDNPSARQIEPALVLPSRKGISPVYNFTVIKKHLHEAFLTRVQAKKRQLKDVGSADSHRIVAGVVNPLRYITFGEQTNYRDILQSIHDVLRWGSGWHFALITGYDSNGIPDDTVYPPLEDNK